MQVNGGGVGEVEGVIVGVFVAPGVGVFVEVAAPGVGVFVEVGPEVGVSTGRLYPLIKLQST